MSSTRNSFPTSIHGRTDEEMGQHSRYEFFVHSQVPSTQNMPSQLESTLMSRQKRRRTSPEDQATLEAAYQRNSKPDKAERTAIVNSVALGEKEVQIWFQNRRQNDRRKSRPLLPHEMVPHFRNSIPRELLHNSTPTSLDRPSSPQTSFSSVDHEQFLPNSSPTNYDSSGSVSSASRASSIRDLLNPTNPAESGGSTSFESRNAHQANPRSSQSTNELSELKGAELSQPLDDCLIRSTSPSPPLNRAYDEHSIRDLATVEIATALGESRNSPAASISSEKFREAAAVRLCSQHLKGPDPQIASRKRVFDEIEELARPSPPNSRIRLSMTLDGAVKVKTGEEDTPSPPKQPPQKFAALRKDGLRRSHSAVATSEFLKEGDKNKARPSSGIFGRSRDAHTWEFYCDGDTRAALSAQAENEHHGSAVGAINLIRSQTQSGKGKALQKGTAVALKPKIGAGNTGKHAASAEPKSQKPNLVRAVSSMARLSGNCKASTIPDDKIGTKSRARRLSGDSDKENWAPGTRCSNHPLRRTQPSIAASRGVLQDEHSLASSTSSSMKRIHGDHQHNGYKGENAISKDGEETGSFRHIEDKEEDLDCIQGLLSLSQGAWR